MKKHPILIASFLFLLLATTSMAQMKGLKVVPINDASGKRVGLYKGSYALVIGVSDYSAGWPKLPSVVDETQQIQAALEANGFHVRLVLDPNEDKLKSEFEQFIDQYGYERDNRLFVFFSGHGYSRKKGAKGYLVPVDAPDPRQDETGFLRKSLPMSQVLAWCRQMEAKHALLLFDSCFSGTIFKTKALPEVPPHISAITSRPVRQFIAAGDAGEEVPAKSTFAECFLRALRGEADLSGDGYVTGSELGMYLRDKVLHYQTGQTPQYGKIRDPDLDEGDFVFVVYRSLAERKPIDDPTVERSQRLAEDGVLEHEIETLQKEREILELRRKLEQEKALLKQEKERFPSPPSATSLTTREDVWRTALGSRSTWKCTHSGEDWIMVSFDLQPEGIQAGVTRFYDTKDTTWSKFDISRVERRDRELVIHCKYHKYRDHLTITLRYDRTRDRLDGNAYYDRNNSNHRVVGTRTSE